MAGEGDLHPVAVDEVEKYPPPYLRQVPVGVRLVCGFDEQGMVTQQDDVLDEARLAVRASLVDPISVARQRAANRDSRIVEYSLFGLPIQTQAVYSILLLVPLGALVVVFLRNFVGITTCS